MSGWIKLHRKLKQWEWFSDHNTFRLFIFLLISVNFEKKKWRGKDVPRGSIITSLPKLSQESGLTVKQVRGSLDKLEKTGEILRVRTNRNTIITLKKFGFYQGDFRAEGVLDLDDVIPDWANTGQTNGTPRAPTQEFKNLNNLNNLKNAGARDGKNDGFKSFSEVLEDMRNKK